MRGDFSRIRLSKGKGYTAVLEQQGRVALDADANEQQFIDARLRRSETVDVIGAYGGPVGDEGFAITVSGDEILIGPGRYYVDGLVCENPAQVSYDNQPFLVVTPQTTAAALLGQLRVGENALQISLQAWQRLVTALDDPCLREPALGQADTTARLQTVWQVVAELATPDPALKPGACCAAMYDAQPVTSTGTLTVPPAAPAADCGCGPVPAAGYRGIENQLYRVEIHDGGNETAATFKWSRENGSVVSAIMGYSGATVQVNSLGPDANLGFEPNQWVELTDDSYEFGSPPNAPGVFYQVQSIDKDDLSVTLTTAVSGIDPGLNARIRRWDQSGPLAGPSGIALSAGTPIDLENGIQVTFGTGFYQPGDYWTIPARTATGQVEWPPCGSDGNPWQLPCSIGVRAAPLACLHLNFLRPLSDTAVHAGTAPTRAEAILPTPRPRPRPVPIPVRVIIEDCRRSFSPLTDLSPAPTAAAIHVEGINWVNDDYMTLDELVANGLTVTLDQAPAGPVSGGNFIVSLEPLAAAEQLKENASTPIRSVEILDPQIVVGGQLLSWMLPANATIGAIQQTLAPAAREGVFARVRVRLLGQAYFASGAAGMIYLDGRALGQPGTRNDGSQRIDLSFPSGGGSTSSDLESWFYLAPVLGITSVFPEYPSLVAVVDANGNLTGVEPTGATGTVSQTITVAVSYPAIAPVTIGLSLTSDTGGVGTIASIPASAQIPRGQTSVSIPVTFTAAPPATTPPTTVTFTVTATLTAAVSSLSSQQSGQFTLTGPPAIIPAPPPAPPPATQ